VCRRLADDPLVAEVAPDDRWDLPLRVLGALHWLALADGIDPWADPGAAVAGHRDFVARFVAERNVQTNEAQRAWALLPAFLALGDGPLELLELGPSGGLNLVWDRFRYSYRNGEWGPAGSPLALAGDERADVPAALLRRRPEIVRRRGIDLEPVDVTTEDGARLLECFVWADQPERLERLRRGIEVVADDPPELIQGDYVELLPSALEERVDGALLVVFQTASTFYLPRDRYAELRRTVERAPGGPVAWLSTRHQDEEETDFEGGFELELGVWPEGPPALVARMGYHGQWLEWVGRR
jgi:hypothetical protein